MRKKIRYAQRATFRDVWRTMELRFKIGLFILLFFVIVGLILPRFNPLDTSQMSTFRKNLPVSSSICWVPTPSARIFSGRPSTPCRIR